MKQQMSKSLQKRVIFLLAATVTFLIIPQSTGLPLRDEMTGVWKLFSQKGLAILFSCRQWLAMELLLFAAVMVTIQMVWEQKEIVYKNKAVKGICLLLLLIFFVPLLYITLSTVFWSRKPVILSETAWIFLFGKQGGANQYILHLWWMLSATFLELGIKL